MSGRKGKKLVIKLHDRLLFTPPVSTDSAPNTQQDWITGANAALAQRQNRNHLCITSTTPQNEVSTKIGAQLRAYEKTYLLVESASHDTHARILLEREDAYFRELAEEQIENLIVTGVQPSGIHGVYEYLIAVHANQDLRKTAEGFIREIKSTSDVGKKKINEIALQKLVLKHRAEYLTSHQSDFITLGKIQQLSDSLDLAYNKTQFETIEKQLQTLLYIHFAEFLLANEHAISAEKKALVEDYLQQLKNDHPTPEEQKTIAMIPSQLKDLITKYLPAEYLQKCASSEATKKLAKKHIDNRPPEKVRIQSLLAKASGTGTNSAEDSESAKKTLKALALQQVTAVNLQAAYLDLLWIVQMSRVDANYTTKPKFHTRFHNRTFIQTAKEDLADLEHQFPELKKLGDEIKVEIMLRQNIKTLARGLCNDLKAKLYFAYRENIRARKVRPEMFTITELGNATVSLDDIEKFLQRRSDEITQFCDAGIQDLFRGSPIRRNWDSIRSISGDPAALDASYALPKPGETTPSAYSLGQVKFIQGGEPFTSHYTLQNTQQGRENNLRRIGMTPIYDMSAVELFYPALTEDARKKKLNELYKPNSNSRVKPNSDVACALALSNLISAGGDRDKRPKEMINALNEFMLILDKGSRVTQPLLSDDHALKQQVRFIELLRKLRSTTLTQKPEDKQRNTWKRLYLHTWSKYQDPKQALKAKVLAKENLELLSSTVHNMTEGSSKQLAQYFLERTRQDLQRDELVELIQNIVHQYSNRRLFGLLDFRRLSRYLGGHDANYETALTQLNELIEKLKESPVEQSYTDVLKTLRTEISQVSAGETCDTADLERSLEEINVHITNLRLWIQHDYNKAETCNTAYNEARKNSLHKTKPEEFKTSVRELSTARICLANRELALAAKELEQTKAKAHLALVRAKNTEARAKLLSNAHTIDEARDARIAANKDLIEAVDFQILAMSKAREHELKLTLRESRSKLQDTYIATLKGNEGLNGLFKTKAVGNDTPLEQTVASILVIMERSNNPIAREASALALTLPEGVSLVAMDTTPEKLMKYEVKGDLIFTKKAEHEMQSRNLMRSLRSV
ncbi:MAG: hypothetical protein JSS53_02215 [Proteobacteria bacterium]|nr:hypothetical protein [Pseudomonadota bacterium]